MSVAQLQLCMQKLPTFKSGCLALLVIATFVQLFFLIFSFFWLYWPLALTLVLMPLVSSAQTTILSR